jgi:hypothetical protein
MLKEVSKRGWVGRAMLWKKSEDIERELSQIEQNLSNCCRRFEVS